MAASATVGLPYLQLGPRQGVYCRPTVVLTAVPGGGYKQEYLTAGGGRLKWRLSQFRSPELGYRLRARSDTEDPPPENIPQIAGRIIERPASAASQQRVAPRPPPARITKSRSSCNLYSSSSSQQLVLRQQNTSHRPGSGAGRLTLTTSGASLPEKHRKSSTVPAFSVQACAITIQSRPPARSLTPPPKRIAPPEEPFPYPDPLRVGGDHTFNIRLSELAGLQREAVKSEEYRARIARRNAAAAATALSANTGSVVNLQTTRQPLRPSSGVSRTTAATSSGSKAGLSRRTSLPAGPIATAAVQDKPPPPPASLLSQTRPSEDSATLNPTRATSVKSIENDSSSKSEAGVSRKNHSAVKHTTPQELDNKSSQREPEKSLCEKGEEEDSVGSDVVVEMKEVTPRSCHRELVESIFSGTSPQKKESSTNEASTISESHNNVPATSHAGQSSKEVSSLTEAVVTTRSSRPRSSKSKTTSHSPTSNTLHNVAPTHTPVSVTSPTSETTPPSSASSTSEQCPSPASGGSGKKAQSKTSTRVRKTHRKTSGRHRNT